MDDEAEDDDFGEDFEDDEDDGPVFADPGGRSALRAASEDNPRNLPCPSCGSPNRLTPADVALGYQCDSCADSAEGFGPCATTSRRVRAPFQSSRARICRTQRTDITLRAERLAICRLGLGTS